MSSDNIEKLYQNYGILADAKEDISKHEKEYLEILAAVKGSDKEKRLASQFIAKFFNSFPNLANEAIDALFDLCEDDDVAIRKQAVKDSPALCKDNKEHTQRIAEVLAQLLQSDDATEISIVTNSLLTILKIDPKATLAGIFSQIHQNTDSEANEIVRERCIKFLSSKVKQFGREVINKEAEDLIISECKKILEDVVADEFEHIMDLLTWSKLGKNSIGRRELVQLIGALAFTPDDWHPEDPECIDRILQCSQHALPLFSAQVKSDQFVNFFCAHILNHWSEIATAEGGADTKLELLKIFAEITEYSGKMDNAQDNINTVYDLLMLYLPEAPVETEAEKSAEKPEANETKEESKSEPSLQFSHVECALFALHSLCREVPEALGADAARLKALRLRLQYTARLTQGYIKKLKEVTQGKKGEDANTEENKLKVAALKTTSNINTLIRDIFRTPPSFKSKVQLSFQTKRVERDDSESSSKEDSEKTSLGQKRHRPITFGNGTEKSQQKRSRSGERSLKMYTPPSGKYSSRFNNSAPRFSGGNYGRGRGRRDFRNTGAPFRRRSNY